MALLTKAFRRNTELRRLLGTSLQLGGKDSDGKRLDDQPGATTQEKVSGFATFMNQWKKDLAAIEGRSRARRKQQLLSDPRTQVEVRRKSEFVEYLEWEMRKASGAWSKKKLTERDVSPLAKVDPHKRALLPRLGPADKEEGGMSKRLNDFNELLSHKTEKARREREVILNNLMHKYKDSPSECKRLERLRSFLDRRELEKIESMRKNYEKKLMSEEQRRRESARIMKIVKEIPDNNK